MSVTERETVFPPAMSLGVCRHSPSFSSSLAHSSSRSFLRPFSLSLAFLSLSPRSQVFGDDPRVPQPSQALFETQIFHAMHSFDPSRLVFLESESAYGWR